jgi:outer membrane protein
MMELFRVINKDLPTTLRLQPLQMDLTNESMIVPSISPTLPQFSEAKWRLQNIRDNIRATKALSFPTIRLSAEYGTFYASSNPERTFVQQLNDTRNGSISLGLNIPIMRGLQNQPRIQEMKISEMIVQNDLERTTLQLTQELKIAISRYQNLKQRYQAANSLYTLANENMQLIQEQVNAGTALMVDFLLAQNNMERALNTLTQTKYQLIHQKMLVSFYTTGKFDLGK